MNIIDSAEKRSASKRFDPGRKIDSELMKKAEELLRLSPSSVNLQPWHYIIAGTDKGKELIAEAAAGSYSYNKSKILNASHVVVFCTKTDLDDSYLDHLMDTEDKAGRFKDTIAKEMQHDVKYGFSDRHRIDFKDEKAWMKNQVYISAGFFLLGAASLGIDTCPMEGFDKKILDKVLGLAEKGYESAVLIAIGYRSSDDFNASLPKSRLPAESIITRI